MATLEEIRKEDEVLFQLYKLLKAKRNRETAQASSEGKSILPALRKEADDYFIIYITLRRLITGDMKGYIERKELLRRRLEEG